jgi:hypothetical protein
MAVMLFFSKRILFFRIEYLEFEKINDRLLVKIKKICLRIYFLSLEITILLKDLISKFIPSTIIDVLR